tara:strand:- start:1822 stop:2010 length:189 start_codon:yes stop_codon:yes gene_type:complete
MSFWEIFKKTAYFRISWKIQDEIINSANRSKRNAEIQSMNRNIKEISDKVYNNKFSEARRKK